MNVLFRVDASKNIGFGHLERCLTLAEAIRETGGRCIFACQHLFGNGVSRIASKKFHYYENFAMRDAGFADFEFNDGLSWSKKVMRADSDFVGQILKDHEFDWLVIDHYAIDETWQERVGLASNVLVLDDGPNRKHLCHALIDASPERLSTEYESKVRKNTKCFTGIQYALIRDEFSSNKIAEYNDISKNLSWRIFVNFGASDQLKMTPTVLRSLLKIDLLRSSSFAVVMGEHAHTLRS